MALSDFEASKIQQRLKELRNSIPFRMLEKKITKKLGEEHFISWRSLQGFEKYIKNTKGMGLDRLDTLAKYYGVSFDYLLGRTDNKQEIVTTPQKRYTISGSDLKRLVLFSPAMNQVCRPTVEGNAALAYEYIRKGLFILAPTIHQKAVYPQSHTVKIQNYKLISICAERDKKSKILYKSKLLKNRSFRPVRAKDSIIGCIA